MIPAGFVRDPDSLDKIVMFHRDGVPWWEARVPRRWHRCRVQTWADDYGDVVERCACGALRFPARYDRWIERNTRRRT